MIKQLKISPSITLRESESFKKYLNDISKYKLTTIEEEVELAKRIRQGDEKALRRLVEANLRFVVSVAKQYQNQGIEISDLINEGNLGLIKAAGRFDESRGFKFISFAVWWIRQSIIAMIAENSRTVRIPLNKIAQVKKYNDIVNKLEQINNVNPHDDDVIEEMGITRSEFYDISICFGRTHSIDVKIGDDSEMAISDSMVSDSVPTPDNGLYVESLKTDINRAFSVLTPRERAVLEMFYGLTGADTMTLEEIGDRFELTRERVRQIKEKALKRLKHGSAAQILGLKSTSNKKKQKKHFDIMKKMMD